MFFQIIYGNRSKSVKQYLKMTVGTTIWPLFWRVNGFTWQLNGCRRRVASSIWQFLKRLNRQSQLCTSAIKMPRQFFMQRTIYDRLFGRDRTVFFEKKKGNYLTKIGSYLLSQLLTAVLCWALVLHPFFFSENILKNPHQNSELTLSEVKNSWIITNRGTYEIFFLFRTGKLSWISEDVVEFQIFHLLQLLLHLPTTVLQLPHLSYYTSQYIIVTFHDINIWREKMSADSLSTTSRGFYERSKAKLTISLVLGAASMMLLGFCADAGGQVPQPMQRMNVFRCVFFIWFEEIFTGWALHSTIASSSWM